MARGTPDIDSVIAEALDSALLGVRVAGVGIVSSYDAATQTCAVVPAVRRPVPDEDDGIIQEADSVCQNVMVAHWGAAALSVHAPLAAGDAVLLVYLDYSPALWRSRGQVSDTPETHAHRYPVAIPFMRPDGGPGPDTGTSFGEPDGTRIHFESGIARVGATVDPAADFVALAAKVDAAIASIHTMLNAFGTTQAAASTGPLAALATGFTTLATAAGTPASPTAGTKLKAG